ncbi:dihydrofolate reductase family protein [Nonomuraea typhae]|uniref:dihydrofolate reductase family protein n=1 Tax=Nonomuraea typhae TaxID=2603600 RepID=UPI0012FA99CB|nr:dihydrofolate reductase family protein [Nonomuraea typhae]
MGKVFTQASVSLDGYISGPGQTGFDRLFAWCTAGTVATPTADPDRLTYLTSEATARYLRDLQERIGACVVGRNLFDLTAGWNGRHPSGVPVFVVTHRPPPAGWEATATPFTFVSDGVENAIARAREVAGHRDVGVGPGGTVADALRAGLLDELRMDVVPVVLGAGTPMLTGLGDTAPIGFDLAEIIEGIGVTHLIYRRATQNLR